MLQPVQFEKLEKEGEVPTLFYAANITLDTRKRGQYKKRKSKIYLTYEH